MATRSSKSIKASKAPEKERPNFLPHRLIHEITLRNFLSYPVQPTVVELGNLNILVGPNGSGKSNFLEAIALLQAAPVDFQPMISSGGGIAAWINDPKADYFVEHHPMSIAHPSKRKAMQGPGRNGFDIQVKVNGWKGTLPYTHCFGLEPEGMGFRVVDELISDRDPRHIQQYVLFESYPDGRGEIRLGGERTMMKKEHLKEQRSILAQRRDPLNLPEITDLADTYSKIAMYRDWHFGGGNPMRKAQATDLRGDVLDEGLGNMNIFLNRRFGLDQQAKDELVAVLRKVYDEFQGFELIADHNTMSLFFREQGRTKPTLPARLSDVSLRFLMLAAVLLGPTPPPLICIDEPEIGLHPDLIVTLAQMLTRASERTQVIVTTHSPILLDAFSTRPEVVLVVEKENGKSTIRRLDEKKLAHWLKDYGLGNVWLRGGIGGTRW